MTSSFQSSSVVDHDEGSSDTEPIDDNSNQLEPTARVLHVNMKKCTQFVFYFI